MISDTNFKNISIKELAEIGFEYDKMKYYKHPDCEYILEFLTPPIAIGNEQIDKFNTLSSPLGTVKILTPTDCVKDRLAVYIYWNDRQSLQQAIMVAKEQQIDLDDIKSWAKNE